MTRAGLESARPGDGLARPDEAVRVGLVGDVPDWLRTAARWWEGCGVAVEGYRDGTTAPAACHVARARLRSVSRLRAEHPGSAIVLDATGPGEASFGPRDARRAAEADLVLVNSRADLREIRRRRPSLTPRTAFLRRPLDPALLGTDVTDRAAARRRRLLAGRLGVAGPLVLFAGPLSRVGGLDLALAAFVSLRASHAGVRLAAVAHERVEAGFLRTCRRSARALGVDLVEADAVGAGAVPWYAAADVVVLPARGRVDETPVLLAGATGRPFVGGEVEAIIEHVVEGDTGYLVPVDDPDALAEVVGDLLVDPDERRRLGEAARRRVESELSPRAAAQRLAEIWCRTVAARPGRAS